MTAPLSLQLRLDFSGNRCSCCSHVPVKPKQHEPQESSITEEIQAVPKNYILVYNEKSKKLEAVPKRFFRTDKDKKLDETTHLVVEREFQRAYQLTSTELKHLKVEGPKQQKSLSVQEFNRLLHEVEHVQMTRSQLELAQHEPIVTIFPHPDSGTTGSRDTTTGSATASSPA